MAKSKSKKVEITYCPLQGKTVPPSNQNYQKQNYPIIPSSITEDDGKLVKQNPIGIYDYKVTWCTSRKDTEGRWGWNEPRNWSDKEWDKDIKPKMDGFKALTWREVDSYSSDSGHKMHHNQEVLSLHKEAQKRWLILGLEEFDTAFRFRFGNKKRAWGIINGAHFYLIWWERNHRIYTLSK